MKIPWPLSKIFSPIPHAHSWRRLNSKEDYGNGSSRHWGNYHGHPEEECRVCGLVRDMDRKEADRLDAEAAVKAAAYNLSDEGLEFWRKRSLKNDGAIMIYDGGTVCRLESGDAYNGESQVLSEGHDGKYFGPEIVFKNGEQVFKRKVAA